MTHKLIEESRVIRIERLAPGDEWRLKSIRLRALADAPAAFGTTFEDASVLPHEDWERQMKELATFIATSDGCDAGIVRGVRHDEQRDSACLISMWVAPEFRRQGVAAALIDAVVQWAKELRFRRLVLDVTEGNSAAMSVYRKKGFTANGIISTLPHPRQHILEHQLEMMLEPAAKDERQSNL
jgi:GNAT superfamily N-acetyltransferase